jgi:hypothetical protein
VLGLSDEVSSHPKATKSTVTMVQPRDTLTHQLFAMGFDPVGETSDVEGEAFANKLKRLSAQGSRARVMTVHEAIESLPCA